MRLEQKIDALDVVDEVNLQLGWAAATLDGVLALLENGDPNGNGIVLAFLAYDSITEAKLMLNAWWESIRSEYEPAASPQDTGDQRSKHRTDRFDCQSERSGS